MKSIYIKNFKNLSELQIDKLSRVNLIIGRNNVGKSTLLEAISTYLAKGSDAWLRKILARRGEVIGKQVGDLNMIKKHYLSLFSGRLEDYTQNSSIIIGESFDDENLLKIQQIKVTGKLTNVQLFSDIESDNHVEYDTEIPCLQRSVGKKSSLIFYQHSNTGSIGEYCFQYVHTIDFNTKDNAALYDSIALTDGEAYLIEALNVINPHIRKINFINDNETGQRIPVVVLDNDEVRYRLSSMGDGINRLLTIILAMLNSRDGALLVDEFDTGLHYSVQDKLWEIVFMLTKKLNVQVFATTHSNDCIRSFAEANENGMGQCIRLDERNGKIVPTIYSNRDDILFALDNNIEVR